MTKTTAVGLLAAALGSALCGFLGTSASAQSTTPAAKPITIKLGAFFPSGRGLKDGVSDTWFSAGAEYALVPHGTQAETPPSLAPLLYVDYAGINKHGINADYVGVGPGARYYLSAPGSTLMPYVGAGIGGYFLHAKGFGTSENKTQFGYRLNAGVEFNQAYLFEINYTDAGSLNGTRFNGFNVQLGARF